MDPYVIGLIALAAISVSTFGMLLSRLTALSARLGELSQRLEGVQALSQDGSNRTLAELTGLRSHTQDLADRAAQRPIQVNLSPVHTDGGSQSTEPLLTSGSAIMYGPPAEPSMVLRKLQHQPYGGTAIKMNERWAGQMETLVENFAGRVAPTFLAASGTYRLVFAPEILNGIRAGALTMEGGLGWTRAWAKDVATGQFAGHGKLVRCQLTPAAATLLVWQVLAAATAQSYLTQINSKLKHIANLVEGLKIWFETEEHGDLAGNYYYLNDVRQVLLNQDFTEREAQAFLVHIEGVERDCERIQARVLLRLQSLQEHYRAARETNSTVEEFLQNAESFAWDSRHGIKSLALALELQVLVCDLHAALRSSPELIKIRLEDVTNRYPAVESLAQECCNVLAEPIAQSKFNHIFNVEQAKKRYDTEVKNASREIDLEQRQLLSNLKNGINFVNSQIRRQMETLDEPLAIDVQIEDGKVKAAFVASTDAARAEFATVKGENWISAIPNPSLEVATTKRSKKS